MDPDVKKNNAFLSSMQNMDKAHAASDADEYIFFKTDVKQRANFLG